jgi:3'(2'), 5'-bisphosphate nucleotidase
MGQLTSFFLEECLVRALPASKQAGEAILDVYHGHIDVTYKEDKSPLTVADERAHSIIGHALSEGDLPSMPILSEEGKDIPFEARKGWESFWLVDPLDGTKEFIKRRGEFTVNIAVIQKNRPVLGVVCLPAKGVVYFAAEGLGAYKLDDWEVITRLFGERENPEEALSRLQSLLNLGRPLPLNEPLRESDRRLTVVGSRSHASEELERFVERAKQQYDEVEFISSGSALKLGMVAEGTAQIYPRFGPTMEWDIGAGQCVVEQSGGAVLHLDEKTPLVYNKRDLLNPGFVCVSKDFKAFETLFEE